MSHIRSIMGIGNGVLAKGSLHDSDIKNRYRVLLKCAQEVAQDCHELGILFMKMPKLFRFQ